MLSTNLLSAENWMIVGKVVIMYHEKGLVEMPLMGVYMVSYLSAGQIEVHVILDISTFKC